MMSMDAFITVSEMTILASQAMSPKGQGYCFHMKYNSEGMPLKDTKPTVDRVKPCPDLNFVPLNSLNDLTVITPVQLPSGSVLLTLSYYSTPSRLKVMSRVRWLSGWVGGVPCKFRVRTSPNTFFSFYWGLCLTWGFVETGAWTWTRA